MIDFNFRANVKEISGKLYKRWTQFEDNFILDLYPSSGEKGVRKVLPYRSASSIKHRASKLGCRTFKGRYKPIEIASQDHDDSPATNRAQAAIKKPMRPICVHSSPRGPQPSYAEIRERNSHNPKAPLSYLQQRTHDRLKEIEAKAEKRN